MEKLFCNRDLSLISKCSGNIDMSKNLEDFMDGEYDKYRGAQSNEQVEGNYPNSKKWRLHDLV